MMVKALKRECRKAECKWRKTKLKIHYDLFIQSLCSFTYKLCRAGQLHFSKLVNRNFLDFFLTILNQLAESCWLTAIRHFPKVTKDSCHYATITYYFIAKIIEEVVFNQLSNFLNSSGQFDTFQSGFTVLKRLS